MARGMVGDVARDEGGVIVQVEEEDFLARHDGRVSKEEVRSGGSEDEGEGKGEGEGEG